MPDYGEIVAEKAIRAVDRRLVSVYRQAEEELNNTIDDFVKKFKKKDEEKRKLLKEGKITENEYKVWLKGQVFQKKQWESKLEDVQKVLANHNQEAVNIINKKKLMVFAENYNHGAYETEKLVGGNFRIYSTETVAQLIKDDPKMLPEWKINQPKDYIWNQKKVNNCITQGIIQGKSIDKITKDMTSSLCTMNRNRMRMFTRTAMTGAQNAGRIEVMTRAEGMGIRVQKQWKATLDGRTRDAHIDLDGQVANKDEPFESEFGKIMYPGDPTAVAANVCNCRCRLKYVYPDFADILTPGKRWDRLDGQSYEEWQEEARERIRRRRESK